MVETVTTIVIAFATSMAGAFGGWFFTKRKYNAEVQRQNLENIDFGFDTWQKVVDTQQERIEELMSKYDLLLEENLKYQDQLNSMREELLILKQENQKLICEIARYEKKLNHTSTAVADSNK